MIFQIDPYGAEMFVASPPLFRATFESSILISFWRVLRRRIGKEKKPIQAWFEKVMLARNTMCKDVGFIFLFIPIKIHYYLNLSLYVHFVNTTLTQSSILSAMD